MKRDYVILESRRMDFHVGPKIWVPQICRRIYAYLCGGKVGVSRKQPNQGLHTRYHGPKMRSRFLQHASCYLLWLLFLAVVAAQSRPEGAITGVILIDDVDTWVEVVGWVACDDGPFVYQIGGESDATSPLDIAGCNADATRGTFRIPLSRTATPGAPIGVLSTSPEFATTPGGFFSFARMIDFILMIIDSFLRFLRLPFSVWSPSTSDTSLAVGDFVYRVPISLSELVSSSSSSTVTIRDDQLALWDATVDMDDNILQVQGTLLCPQFADSQMVMLELRTAGVVVGGSAARWVCTIDTVEWTVSLTGQREAVYDGEALGVRAMVAVDGGIVRWTGASGKEGYYYLQQTAEAGDNTLRLDDANASGGWEVGDPIVIAPTDFSPWEAEERVITAIAGNQITLDEPLDYRHWGSTEFHSNGKGQSWILDERAEVFNLRRNIRIRAIDDDLTTTWQLGGHVMIHGGFGYFDNVEFHRMGQAGRPGRYPVHFHLSGDRTGNFVQNSSIHQSFSRCAVIHQTHNVKLERNSCYDHFGHGFFLEDGNERGNQIIGNIGVLSKRPPESLALLASDITGDPLRFAPPATFWISHPDNIVRNNVASGSEGSGFWMAFVSTTGSGISPTEQPRTTNTLVFDRNIAHSMVIGVTHDGAPTGELTGNALNPKDRALESAHYDPPTLPVFNDLVTYKCSGAGIYFRGTRAAYRNVILADNSFGLFMAFDQEIENSLVVGISENNNAASELAKYSGAMVYDGTCTVPFLRVNLTIQRNRAAIPRQRAFCQLHRAEHQSTGQDW